MASHVCLQGAARACRLSIEAEWEGHEAFFINGHDTTLVRHSFVFSGVFFQSKIRNLPLISATFGVFSDEKSLKTHR